MRKEPAEAGLSKVSAALADFRQRCSRHFEEFAQVHVPAELANVVEQGATGVRVIGGKDLTIGQAMNQIRIDGADDGLAACKFRLHVGVLFDEPLQLGSGKIGVKPQASEFGDANPMAGFLQLSADFCAAATLPDDGVVQWTPSLALKDANGFALIGEADTGECFVSMTRDQYTDNGEHVVPDLIEIVLDPAWLRVDLLMILRLAIKATAVSVVEQRFGRRRALIDGEDVTHARSNKFRAVCDRPSIEMP